jgi:hypothetical protein
LRGRVRVGGKRAAQKESHDADSAQTAALVRQEAGEIQPVEVRPR